MLIKENIAQKDQVKLIDKLIDLIYLQAKEIDIIHYKLFILEGKPLKALEVLEMSKNIEEPLKVQLKSAIKKEELDESSIPFR